MRFTIGIVKRGKNLHSDCFLDFARALAGALRQLGHEVSDFDRPGRLIMFGAGLMVSDPSNQIPRDAIVFNAEQLSAVDDPRFFVGEQYRDHVVWDFSSDNVRRLRESGVRRAVHCPLGYDPSMTTIGNSRTGEEEVDVLFYGSVNERRREVLDALDRTGLRVARSFGSYGAERDALIARSKVVLNVHFYDRSVFEVFRVSHLVANRKCVVSESGGSDSELEDLARRIAWTAPRERLVDECRSLALNDEVRVAVAERCHEEFKRTTSLVENVRRALSESDL